MNCKEIQEKILDDSLKIDSQDNAHLQKCKECSDFAKSAETMLDSVLFVEPDKQLDLSVLNYAREFKRNGRPIAFRFIIPAAAAACLVILFAVNVLFNTNEIGNKNVAVVPPPPDRLIQELVEDWQDEQIEAELLNFEKEMFMLEAEMAFLSLG